MKIEETFSAISEIRKTREKFPRKFPRNFPENSQKIGVLFDVKCNGTERKSCFLFL